MTTTTTTRPTTKTTAATTTTMTATTFWGCHSIELNLILFLNQDFHPPINPNTCQQIGAQKRTPPDYTLLQIHLSTRSASSAYRAPS